jgi:aspartate/methionine/tyrosine aminotransferase
MDLAWAAGDVIHLEVGEPNFPTPVHIVEAADRAARTGQTKYTPTKGVAELRRAIADKLNSRNQIDATDANVVVTAGGVQALYLSLMAVAEPGDGVLLPDPGWPNYSMMVTVLGATAQPYRLRPDEQYLPCVDDLERAASPSTRAVILNSPSNPLGSVLMASRGADILDWARQHRIWVLSDECYDEIVFDDSFVSLGALEAGEQVISCYSFSKTYAMTGWRVGYIVSRLSPLVDVLAKVQQAAVSCVNAPAQAAALAALTGPQDCVEQMRTSYLARRDAAVDVLKSAGVDVLKPAGAFYLWVDASPFTADDWSLATSLLRDVRVAVAPGSAFGSQGLGHLRLSLATETSVLLEGCRRITDYLSAWEG